MKRKMALLTKQGTACPETVLIGREDTPQNRASMEAQFCNGEDDSPVANTWTDCSENTAL